MHVLRAGVMFGLKNLAPLTFHLNLSGLLGHGLPHNFLLCHNISPSSLSLPFSQKFYKNSSERCQERRQMLLVRIKANSWATGEVTPTTSLRRTPPQVPKLSDVFSVALAPERCLSIASVSHCFNHSKKSISARRPIAPGDHPTTGK